MATTHDNGGGGLIRTAKKKKEAEKKKEKEKTAADTNGFSNSAHTDGLRAYRPDERARAHEEYSVIE